MSGREKNRLSLIGKTAERESVKGRMNTGFATGRSVFPRPFRHQRAFAPSGPRFMRAERRRAALRIVVSVHAVGADFPCATNFNLR